MKLEDALGHIGAYLVGGDEFGIVSEADAAEAYDIICQEIASLRRQLDEVQSANQWYRPFEKLPTDGIEMGNCIIPCFAYWRGAGSMYVEFWPCADGSRLEWKIAPQTPLASWRTPPLCWRYFPVPPASMKEQATE